MLNIEDILPGKQLPNGRFIIEAVLDSSGDGVVLAQNDRMEPTEWVTWEFYRHDLRSTSHGHYFRDSNEALLDYKERRFLLIG